MTKIYELLELLPTIKIFLQSNEKIIVGIGIFALGGVIKGIVGIIKKF